DEAHRRHPVAPAVERFVGGLDDRGMARQPEVVVGAHVQELAASGDRDVCALRRRHHELGLVRAGLARGCEAVDELVSECSVHGFQPPVSVQSRITLPDCPDLAIANASSKSRCESRCVITGLMSSPEASITDIWYQVSYISRP